MRRLFLLLLVLMPLLACRSFNLLASPTPPSMPSDLAATPLPAGSRLGGLEATFASLASDPGVQSERCHRIFRFYPDGLALYAARYCFQSNSAEANWQSLSRAFHPQAPDTPRGDYSIADNRIWIRIARYDHVHETYWVDYYQGEYCDDFMVLQQPQVTYFAGVPSPLTQPVQEYVCWSPASVPTSASSPACHVAGFRILSRPTVVLRGGEAIYEIQTDPGETCALRYTAPDGVVLQGEGTGETVADESGVCRWRWSLGDQAGMATVTVGIDQISQDFSLEVR